MARVPGWLALPGARCAVPHRKLVALAELAQERGQVVVDPHHEVPPPMT